MQSLARPLLLVGLLLLADLALVAPSRPPLGPFPAEAGRGAGLGESGWLPSSPNAGALPYRLRRLAVRESSCGGDGFKGEHRSGWYRAGADLTVLVAGYPNRPLNHLSLEARAANGSVQAIGYDGADVGETWRAWQPTLPAGSVAIRIVARDGTAGYGGWLGFSEPFSLGLAQTWDGPMTRQTVATVALAVVLVFGPGLLWRAGGRRPALDLLWPGPLGLAVGGGLVWALGGVLAPRLVATGWVVASLAGIAWAGWKLRPWRRWSATEARVYLLIPLIVLGAAAKAAFSGGPADELFAGTVSRSLEVGGHSDSRISYHTVQVVANHLGPQSPEADDLFAPWQFFSRGPLAGLAAAPIVLATHGHPPVGLPTAGWEPFDYEGFAAFRIAMMALACLGLVAVWALLESLCGESRAWLGASLVALAPFLWHEAYFSWPKLAAAAWVLGSFAALRSGRPFRAGLWLGGAYLFHPLALLSAPFLAGWELGEGSARRLTRRWWDVGLLGVGLGAVVLGLNLANGLHVSTQAGFLQYAKGADEVYGASAGHWFASRWTDTLNTLMPGWVALVNASHPSYNPIGKVSGPAVHFWLQYWTAAPFAVGLFTFVVLLPVMAEALRRRPRVAFAVLVGPFGFLILFWGAASTGLMREAGHPLFLTGWVFLVWAAGDRVPAWVVGRGFTAVRAIEVVALLFGTAWLGQKGGGPWRINDAIWSTVAWLCVGGVAWVISAPLKPFDSPAGPGDPAIPVSRRSPGSRGCA